VCTRTYLLRCCLKRQHSVWCAVDLFDLLRVGNEDITIIRSEELEWFALGLVEGLLNDFRAPEEICPGVVPLDKGTREFP